VRETLKGWLGLVVAPAAYLGGRSLLSSMSTAEELPRDIGAAATLHPGMSKMVQLGNKRVLVFIDREGQMRAVDGICTHLGCSIRFEPDRGNGELACNCHESRFTLRGENLNGPATRPLSVYQIENQGGRLILSQPGATARKP
jgi:Rieske Fe-S protein